MTEADFDLWGRTLNKAFNTFPEARFIIHNGDLTENPQDETAWDHFFGKASKWLSRIPLMPVTGNHDEVDGEAERYIAHFNLPDNGAGGSLPGTSYSFDYGDAHFIILNTESNIDGQTEWLRQDLQSTDKQWRIAAIHRPVYGGNTYSNVQEWAKLFDEFDVDLVLQGHNHEYSRSYPVRGGGVVTASEGTVYVTINAAGQKLNEKKKDKFYHAVHFQNGKQMFAGVKISGNTIIYQAYDVEGALLDEFVLERDAQAGS
ncbi:Alkaline phosphatase precursor [compost metagenome]